MQNMINIVVAFPKFEDAANIKNLLVRNGYSVACVCTSGAKVLSVADEYNDGIVICGHRLTDMLYSDVKANLPQHFDMILLASANKLSDAYGLGIVSVAMPLRVNDLVNTIDLLAENIARKKKRLREQPKKRSMEEQSFINEAKRILMEKNNLSEYEAHRYIQKTSMDSGTNMVETARMIIRIMMN